MFEKVNPAHVDKIADRIAGAMVDLAYKKQQDPKIAVEVLIGHGLCTIIAESSVEIDRKEVIKIVNRITETDNIHIEYRCVPQDKELAKNQKGEIKCGDNGIFRGMPTTAEERELLSIAKDLYNHFYADGKYIIDKKTNELIICQSNASKKDIKFLYPDATAINPLGYWTGGTDVDTGATNRKLGSDMGRSVTGGGLWGKDLSKADVSINIYVWLTAQLLNKPVEVHCTIGDTVITDSTGVTIPYERVVAIARWYINRLGGFEKFAEWGFQEI